METTYDVSVIIPTFNCGAYLEKCIDSLLRQETGLTYELIVVDDGSTDNTKSVCEKYRDVEILSYYHKQNSGVSDARNYGIRVSRGDYILFVDADDYVMPDYVECLAGKAVKGGFDLVAAGYVIVFEKEGKTITNAFQEDVECRSRDEMKKEALAFGADGLLNVSVCKCFRKRTVLKRHLAYDPELKTGEDLVFNAAFLLAAESLALVKKTPYRYIRRDAVTGVNSYKEDLYSMILKCLNAVNELYRANGWMKGKGMVLIGNFYLDYISAGIYNLYRKECPLSFWEKNGKLRELFALDEEKRYVRSDRRDLLSRLVASTIRMDSSVMANLIYSVLFGLRNHLRGAYVWLRGKVIHKAGGQNE